MGHSNAISNALKAAACLLLLAISATCVASSRVLDEAEPPAAPLAAPPETTDPTPATIPTPTTAPAPAFIPEEAHGPVATSAAQAHHEPLTFFMHDILGGSHASARAVTGLVATTSTNGLLPFGKPNGGVFPVNGGVPLPNGNIPFATGANGAAILNNNGNNAPFLTGQGGQTGSTIISSNGNNVVVGGNQLPFVAGGQLPVGSTLQSLVFGTMTVIDDELTEGHEAGSGVVGRAQGFYVASSEDGTSQTMVFTAMLEGEGGHGYEDSISFFGVHRTVSEDSQVAVIGGTGKYSNAKGYAAVKTVPVGEEQHTTDGAETLLQLAVYLY